MAHGEIYIKLDDKKTVLEYYENGSRQIYLDDEFFSKFDKRIKYLHIELREVIDYFLGFKSIL